MSARCDTSGLYPYGTAHKRLREAFARRMRNGERFECWRPDCQLPGVAITLGVKWDLDHVETPELRVPCTGRAGPSIGAVTARH